MSYTLGRKRKNEYAWRGAESPYLFRYRAGDDLSALGAVTLRSTTATYEDAAGVVQTAAINSPRDGHYIAGARKLLLSMERTNVALWNRDLTNAAWVKSNCTAAKDQVGAGGVANSASSLAATAGNATCLQSIALVSSARFQTAYVKRLAGAGVVQMTMDNGITWTPITVTAGWTRVSVPTQTLANPTIGFRIVTSGDAIAVDLVQNENGASPSSAIPTEGAIGGVTRGADSCYFPWTYQVSGEIMTAYMKLTDLSGAAVAPNARFFEFSVAGGDPRFVAYRPSSAQYNAFYAPAGLNSQSSPAATSTVINDTAEIRMWLGVGGTANFALSVNGAAEVVGPAGIARGFTSWLANTRLNFGSSGTSPTTSEFAIDSFVVARGVKSLAEMQALV